MNSDKKSPDYFRSMEKTSILYGIFDDIIVDAIIDKQKLHERDLTMQHLARLSNLGLHSDSVVIFDGGYISADMFAECHNPGCRCLMRLNTLQDPESDLVYGRNRVSHNRQYG